MKKISTIEARCLKNIIIFLQTILTFAPSRIITNVYYDIAWKYGDVTVKDFRKYERLEYKKNRLKLDIDFLNNCKQIGVYPKFLVFKLPNVLNEDSSSTCKRLLRSTIDKHNKELQHVLKELSKSENCLNSVLLLTSTSLKNLQYCTTINHYRNCYILLSLLTRDCSLPIFTANETITNLTQYELSQEESDLLKAGLYFSIQPDKIRKSEIFTTFEKIHCSFINNLKSEETKNQIKVHLLYLANSCFYNYKPSPHILCQNCISQNIRKNKDFIITKPDKGNGVFILDRKSYDNTVQILLNLKISMKTKP